MSENAKEERDVRAALQLAVAQVCLEEEMSDDAGSTAGPAHMSTQAVQALSELVYQYATCCLSNDLLAFSRHANRRTITPDDVLLVARKDPKGLQDKLRAFAQGKSMASSRKEKSTSRTMAAKQTAAASSQQLTQRMLALEERLKKGIDSDDSSESSEDVEMADAPRTSVGKSASLALSIHDSSDDDIEIELGVGKENNKRKAATRTPAKINAMEDPFASTDDEDKANAEQQQPPKRPAVAEFLPGGTKTGLSSSSDESETSF